MLILYLYMFMFFYRFTYCPDYIIYLATQAWSMLKYLLLPFPLSYPLLYCQVKAK